MKRPLAILAALPLALCAVPALTATAGAPAVASVDPASRAGSVTITYPSAGETVPAGDLVLLGRAGATAAAVKHSVIYAVDLSSSTEAPDDNDCSGDGTIDDADDLNGNGSIGDTLDCEIASVLALNSDVAGIPDAATNVAVGILGFADDASLAQMSANPGTEFVRPGQADVTPSNVAHVATNLDTERINQFAPISLPDGTDYNDAMNVALDSLDGRPGNKWVFFVSDGESTTDVTAGTFDRIRSSGARIRTFAVGERIGSDACIAGSQLYQIAEATGEDCTFVADPTALAANLTGSTPANIDSVTITGLGSAPIAATVDALGNWEATAPGLTDGTYTATATAQFNDGTDATATVSFTVGTVSGPDNVDRWDGADRYEASAKISERSFAPGVGTAFIASGEIFTDALSGSPVAGDTPGPVLLVSRTTIPGAIRAELARLKPRRIVVLGGPNTITTTVESQLGAFSPIVERWDGADRYEASADISKNYFKAGVETAFVASGLVFPDALSGSPIAGDTPGPMLLTRTDALPEAIKTELARLKPKDIVVLGGPASVNDTVQRELRSYTSGTVERWSGLDRYEASAAISRRSFKANQVTVAYVASGLIFTDALSGSSVAGDTPGPMLLVKTNEIPPAIDTELNRLKPDKIVILGGPNSVSAAVEAELESYVP